MNAWLPVKSADGISPLKKLSADTKIPIVTPNNIPVRIAFLARSSFPAPTFCATKADMDCISEDGISMINDTTFCAIP